MWCASGNVSHNAMIGRVSVKYCSTRPMTFLWPIRIGFCPASGGGPHLKDYSFNLAEEARHCRNSESGNGPTSSQNKHDSFTQSEAFVMQNNDVLSPLKETRVRAVIERLIESPRLPLGGSPSDNPEISRDPLIMPNTDFPFGPSRAISSICYVVACVRHASSILRLR